MARRMHSTDPEAPDPYEGVPSRGQKRAKQHEVTSEMASLGLALAAMTPAVRATVTWGRVALGETPVSLPFPRDSGPVDIVVRAPGYLTTHTRLNTFASDSVTVKLVPEAEKKTVFGFKKEAPPPVVPVPDGGVPPGIAAPGVAAPGTAPPGLARPAPAAVVPVPPGAARPATPAAPVSAPGPWTPPAAR